jgi:hypothetical protein
MRPFEQGQSRTVTGLLRAPSAVGSMLAFKGRKASATLLEKLGSTVLLPHATLTVDGGAQAGWRTSWEPLG